MGDEVPQGRALPTVARDLLPTANQLCGKGVNVNRFNTLEGFQVSTQGIAKGGICFQLLNPQSQAIAREVHNFGNRRSFGSGHGKPTQ